MRLKLLIPIFILLILVSCVFADGGMWVKPHDDDLWRLHDEEEQFCAINYKDGYQNMILNIAIDVNLEGEKAVWIFPVPSEPEETVIDIVRAFPEIRGVDIKKDARDNIKGVFSLLRVTQIYPIPFELARYVVFGASKFGGITAGAEMAMGDFEELVIVHEHIEEYGLATELITAKDATAFWNYIALKDLELPEDAKAVFNDYIGEEYSFVVSWINDIEEFKNFRYYGEDYARYDEQAMPEIMPYPRRHYDRFTIGVEVDFPTDEIYFPLKPTSVYGSKRVPAVIYVMDHVIPDFYPNIEKDSSVTYYYENSYYVPGDLENFFFNEPVVKDLSYTKINIAPPSKLLTEDLWMKLGSPIDVKIANCIVKNPVLVFFFFWILCSVLASILSALIIFRKDRPVLWKFALWGLWNLLSIIGFIIATIFLKTKTVDLRTQKALKKQGLRVVAKDLRKIWYVLVFSLMFIGLTILFEILARLFI